MLRYMLDSSICIRVMRNRSPAARARFVAEAGSLAVSMIVLMELLVGAEKCARPTEGRLLVERFVSRTELLAFDAPAADHAARIRAVLERDGQGIGANDTLIAGHARSRGLILVTGNLGEFGRIDGLSVEDWSGTIA